MTDLRDGAAGDPDVHLAASTDPDGGKRSDSAFLSGAACAISTVFIATHSVAATVATALVAAILAGRPKGR